MTDHPPAIPAIQVRRHLYPIENHTGVAGYPFQAATVVRAGFIWTVPLGLSPEQPARLGGEPMP